MAASIPPEIENLEPKLVWRLFAGMSAVPRPSKHEERIRRHIREIVEKHGLAIREDACGNITVKVPASPGCESSPITVLQGHVDMVCEKNAGTNHDFDKEGIRLILDKDPAEGTQIVRADGTTLGADNGIGVAMGLAVAFSPDITHGPLELLFTVDEEAGMTGAKSLTPESFEGRRLLNLDSEEDDTLTVGCAGGCDTTLTWTFPTQPTDGGVETACVNIRGLRGGHSGCDIHENRGSAVKLLARTLHLAGVNDMRLGAISGGSKRNAIAREASATVSGPSGTVDALRAAAETVCLAAKRESSEPHAAIDVETTSVDAAMSAADTARLVDILNALPHGVLGMNPSVPDLVQTSNNVAIINAEHDAAAGALQVRIGTLSRSSSATWIKVACEQIASVGRLTGAEIDTGNEYPGWDPDFDSPLLATCRRIYQDLFGEEPGVSAIHAGLECGIIGERVGDMDAISLGPRIEGAHSPEERIWVASVQKSWKYLLAILAELARG